MSIKDYWIDELKEVKEFEVIAKIEDGEISNLKHRVKNLMDDQFIEIATENGISRRERMLKITPLSTDDLESRRFRVKVRWNDNLPYTYRVLENKLKQLYGKNNYKLELINKQYILKVEISDFNWSVFNEVIDSIRRMIPLNMVLCSALIYRIKSVSNYATAMVSGEEITVYPWSVSEITSKGNIDLGSATRGVEEITVYPKGVI